MQVERGTRSARYGQGQELTDEQLEVIAGGAWYDCDGHEGNVGGT